MENLEKLQNSLLDRVASAGDLEALESLRVQALGKKGEVTQRLKSLGGLAPDERKEAGQRLNRVKEAVSEALDARRADLEERALEARLQSESVDVTLPARPAEVGRIHPISQTFEELVAIFGEMGFSVAEGPHIEEDYYNFTALNIHEAHPARQEMDTFYMRPAADGSRKVLRTHTSPVQIRHMLTEKPPIRIIVPGRTFRADHDATHSPMFHQVEGLVVDKKSHMGHLKGTLTTFCRTYFGIEDLPLRFRPSYFPFTEPSAELDIGCSREGGELKIGAGKDWLEILGSGMVHPKVLANCGIDPDVYQGFAFGMGIERIGMLKYGFPDLRIFFETDLRWMKHYGFVPLEIPSLVRGT